MIAVIFVYVCTIHYLVLLLVCVHHSVFLHDLLFLPNQISCLRNVANACRQSTTEVVIFINLCLKDPWLIPPRNSYIF
jgi:hypothetical protein